MSTRMDDTFSFVAPVMPRRQVDPFALRLAVAATIAVILVGSFATFVVRHERAADARRAALEERLIEQERARAEALVADTGADPQLQVLLDEQARATAELAVDLARGTFATTSRWTAADPARLSDAQPSLVFVDGPSTSPTVVSINATRDAWAAAVMGPSGTCYWAKATSSGALRYGTGQVCTGLAALDAASVAW